VVDEATGHAVELDEVAAVVTVSKVGAEDVRVARVDDRDIRRVPRVDASATLMKSTARIVTFLHVSSRSR
jgi:hypothetical protein